MTDLTSRDRLDLMLSDPERYRAIVEAEVSEMLDRDLERRRRERLRWERQQRKGHRAPQNWPQRAWSKLWEIG